MLSPNIPLLCLLLLVVSGASDMYGKSPESDSSSFQCMNPLFRGHWHSRNVEVAHLEDLPIAYTDLVRCKMWNYHASCCDPSMEAPQQLAFDSHQAQQEEKVAMLSTYLTALETLRLTDVYSHADAIERGLLDRALDSFRPALQLGPRCTEAIVLFMAGMICFGCNPRWDDFVWRDSAGAVTAVKITTESCIYVDQRCGAFGRVVAKLNEHIMESTLAKRPQTPLPDLSMFKDRISTCEWLRGVLALQPFQSVVRGSSAESARRLSMDADDFDPFAAGTEETSTTRYDDGAQVTAISTSTLPEAVVQATAEPPTTMIPTAPPYATDPDSSLDPIRDGEQSGFQFTKSGEMHAGKSAASLRPQNSRSRNLLGIQGWTDQYAVAWRRLV